MSRVEFIKPDEDVICYVADNMSPAHSTEVMASSGVTPIEALMESVNGSEFVGAALIDGTPASVFGLSLGAIVGGIGCPWMLGTQGLATRPRHLMSYSKVVVGTMKNISPMLCNEVHYEYESCIRWLKWLGFTVHDPKPTGMNGELFCKFTMGMDDV